MYHLGAVLGDAALLRTAEPTIKPVMFCRNTRGILALGTQLDEVGAFLRGFGEQNAVVGDDAHGVAVNMGEAAHQLHSEQGLELVEFRTVDDPGDHLADIVGLSGIPGDNAVDVFGFVERSG